MSLLSSATPVGKLKEAAVPVPSAEPELPLPAKVVTTPAGVIFLMRLLSPSATYTLSLLSTATPKGLLKEADVPVASVAPLTPSIPAKVLTRVTLSKLNQEGRVVPLVAEKVRVFPLVSLPSSE